LLVDDEEGARRALAAFLRLSGHQVAEAGGVREGLEKAAETLPHALVCDFRMEDGTGLDLARRLRAQDPGLKVVLLTGFADREVEEGTGGAVDLVMEKPARPRRVRAALEELLARKPGDPILQAEAGTREVSPGRISPGARARREERRLLWGEEE